MKIKKALSKLPLMFLLTLAAAIWLLPLYTMVANSLKTQQEISQAQYYLPPRGLEFVNYITAFGVLKQGLQNSVLVAVPATAIAVFLGSWSGFFLARMRFKYSQTIFFTATIATFLPYQVVLYPLTRLLMALDLINTKPGLILAYLILNTPMAMLVTATFFQSFPVELEEAAALDGCGPITFYWKILLPVGRLAIISTAILIFTLIWNEFLVAMAMTQGPAAQMATPVLAGLKGNYAQVWHIQMAGSMLTSLPSLLIFIFLGRFYIAGLTAGATKG
ncbi:MAG: carbohydrate ABC transporter permease [Anaerolineales bacterium]|nr:carbohydrate ABC transporter permease [Anaerolineales bacterium]